MIRNINDLQKTLDSYIEKALKLTEDKIFEVVSQKVIEYYNEPVFDNPDDPTTPVYYNRTGKMLEELTASHISKQGNDYSFTVGWDNEYLNFSYKKGFITAHYGNSHNGITGLQVLQAMNNETHGYTVEGTHSFWNEAIDEINNKYGNITNLFKQNCKMVGLSIN